MFRWISPTIASLVSAILALGLPLLIVTYYKQRIKFRQRNLCAKIHELGLEKEYLRIFQYVEWENVQGKTSKEIKEAFDDAFKKSFEGENSPKNYFLPLLLTFLTTLIMALVIFASLQPVVAKDLYFLSSNILPFAIAGGLFYVYPTYVSRFASLSLNPSCLYELAGKLWLSIIVGVVSASLFEAAIKPVAAFLGSLLPVAALDLLKNRIFEKKKEDLQKDTSDIELTLLQILENDEQLLSQLNYIGIHSMLELAYENPLKLFIETDLNLEACLYLIDRANLYLYVPARSIRQDLNRYGIRSAVDLMTLLYEYNPELGPDQWLRPDKPLPDHLKEPLREIAKTMKLEHIDSLRNQMEIMHCDPKLTYLLDFWQTVGRKIDKLIPA